MANAELGMVFKAIDETSGVMSRIKNGIGDVAKIATGFVVGGALTQLPNLLFSGAQGAAEDAASMDRLRQAVANVTAEVGAEMDGMNDLITVAQKRAFTDDQARDSLVALLNATEDTTEAGKRFALAQDFARGANIDLVSASKLLGKANEENVNVLRRMGIALKDGATEADLFAAVQKRFGGQADTFAKSTAGSFERVKIRMGELQESLGYLVLPMLDFGTKVLDGVVIPALEKLVALIGTGLSPVIAAVGPVIGSLGKYLSFTASEGDHLNDWLTHLPGFMQPVVRTIGELVVWFQANLPKAIAFAQAKFAELKVYFDSDIRPALENIGKAIMFVVQTVIDNWPTIMKVVGPVMAQVENIIRTVVGVITNLLAIVIDLLAGDFSGAWTNLQELVGVVWDGLVNTIRNAITLIGNLAGLALDAGASIGRALGNAIIDALNGLIQSIGGRELIPGNTQGPIKWDAVRMPYPPRIPRLDTGLRSVPDDMLAVIHRREAVLTPAQADEWRGGNGGGKRGVVVNVNVTNNGSVFGADLKRLVVDAVSEAGRRGELRRVFASA